jgi:hypothetical protein
LRFLVDDDGNFYEEEELPEVIEHFGVKGMRWGHRKQEDSSDARKKTAENAETKAYIAALKPTKVTPKQRQANLEEHHKKFLAKFQPPTAKGDEDGLSRNQKIAITTAASAALAVGGYLAYRRFFGTATPSPLSFVDRLRDMGGKPISGEEFGLATQHSTRFTWGTGDHLQPSSFLRGEKTLPKGHVFHRISTSSEKDFFHATYSIDNPEDLARYTSRLSRERGASSEKYIRNLTRISFTAKEEIKIPSTTTAVETMREVLSRETNGVAATRENAIRAFNMESGSSWGGERATKFVEALKAKGYHGVVDEMDAGVIGESPLVLFSGERFTSKVSTRLNWEDVQKADSSLIEIANRKLPSIGDVG